MNNLSASNWQRKRVNLSSIVSFLFLNGGCLGFSSLFELTSKINVRGIKGIDVMVTFRKVTLISMPFKTNMKYFPNLFNISIYFYF